MPDISFIVYGLKSDSDAAEVLATHQHLRGPDSELIAVLPASQATLTNNYAPYADRLVVFHDTVATTLNTAASVASGDTLAFVHVSTVLPSDAHALISHALTPGNRVWGRFDIRYSGNHRALRLIERLSNLWSRQIGSGSLAHGIFATRLAYELAGRYTNSPVFTDLAFCHALKQLSRPACIRTAALRSSSGMEARGIWKSVLLATWLNLSYRLGVDPGLLHLLAQRYQTLDAVAAPE